MASCVFCGERAQVVDQVLPRWIGEHLGERPDEWWMVERYTSENGWQLRRDARVVAGSCAGCFDGWIAQLDLDAQPLLVAMLAGESVPLSQDDQRLLAFWAVKTVMLLDLASGDNTWMPDHYRQFRRSTTPSRKTRVALAAITDAPQSGCCLSSVYEVDGRHMFNFTLQVRHLVIGVHGAWGGPNLKTKLAAASRDVALGIWPVAGGRVTWPKQEWIADDRGLRSFALAATPYALRDARGV